MTRKHILKNPKEGSAEKTVKDIRSFLEKCAKITSCPSGEALKP